MHEKEEITNEEIEYIERLKNKKIETERRLLFMCSDVSNLVIAIRLPNNFSDPKFYYSEIQTNRIRIEFAHL